MLTLIARGLDNGAIAAALTKSEKTVRNQVSSIFAKLDVKTRAQAIVLARELRHRRRRVGPGSHAADRFSLKFPSVPGHRPHDR